MNNQSGDSQKFGRTLYAGCGIGLDAIELACKNPEGSHVVGIDPSPGLMEMAKRNKGLRSARNVEFVQSTLENYRADGMLFDRIVIGDGEKLPMYRETLYKAAIGLLAEGGCVVGFDRVTSQSKGGGDCEIPFYVDPIDEHGYSVLLEGIGYSDVKMEDASPLPLLDGSLYGVRLRSVAVTAFR